MKHETSYFAFVDLFILLFLIAWVPDIIAILISGILRLILNRTVVLWLVRLMFLLVFTKQGSILFQSKQNYRDHPRWLYITYLLAFLFGVVFYYLIITFYFEGIVELDELKIISRPSGGWTIIWPLHYFSWVNYLLFPILTLLALFRSIITAKIKMYGIIISRVFTRYEVFLKKF